MKDFRGLFASRKTLATIPIGPAEFRRRLARYLIFQVTTLLIGWGVYAWGTHLGTIELQFAGIAWIVVVQAVLALRLVVFRTVVGRLLDIHPDLPEKRRWLYEVCLLCPLTAVPFAAYLSFAKATTSRYFSFLVKRPGTIAASVFFLAICPIGPLAISLHNDTGMPGAIAIAYWSSTPTTYYVSALCDEVRILKKARAEIQASKLSESLTWRLSQYSNDNNPSVTGMVLMLVFETMHAKKKALSDRKLASDDRIRQSLAALDGMRAIIELVEKSSSPIPNFNPISLLSPSGMTEISLLMAVETVAKAKVYQKTVATIRTLLVTIETQTKDVGLLQQLGTLRESFEMTQIFRSQSSLVRRPATK